jgi:uncharacterized protein YjbJ (UPF0337 family)
MGNVAKRGKGAAKQLGGKAERKLGRLVGSEQMQRRGRARELEGAAEEEGAKARERIEGHLEEARGSLQVVKGRLRKRLNQPSDDAPEA